MAESTHNIYESALRLYGEGNFNQALHRFRQLAPQAINPEISKLITSCLQKEARKLWRQDKLEGFQKIIKELCAEDHLSLAYARLAGKEALSALANASHGLMSKLAACSLSDDVKTGLLLLTKIQNEAARYRTAKKCHHSNALYTKGLNHGGLSSGA